MFSLIAVLLVAALAAPTQPAACAACGPVYGEWEAMSPSILEPRSGSTAIWTGKEVLFWGGIGYLGSFIEGALYNPRSDQWRVISPSPLYSRTGQYVVWTGKEVIIWGGTGPDLNGTPVGWLNDGARYNPALDQWTIMSSVNAPSPRGYGAAVWTGEEMIIWGGLGTGPDRDEMGRYGNGGRYNPSLDQWTPIPSSLANSPSPRNLPAAVWTGQEMMVWGGEHSSYVDYQDGAMYNPALNQWRPMSGVNAPAARVAAQAFLIGTPEQPGSKVLIIGGAGSQTPVTDGAIYDPVTDQWRAITPTCGASPFGVFAWTGTELYAWTDSDDSIGVSSGVRYNPALDVWSPLPLTGAPNGRIHGSTVWTGREFILWGGERDWGMTFTNDGGRLLIYPYQLALPAVSIMSGAPGLVSPEPLSANQE